MLPALILFAATYVLMLVFSKYRPYIALGSAAIFIVTGMLPLNEIIPNIDLNVLLMIAGTMGLVALFIESRMPELLTYAAMNEAIWGAVDPGGNKKLQVNMANLRRKLGIRPGDNRYIVNELGVGYRMQQNEE